MPVNQPCRSCNALLTDGFQGDADPFSLYSLQGPAYSFVANCPPGFDCSNAPYLLLNCCGDAIMVNLLGVTGAQRTQAISDAMTRCLRSWQYCGQVPVIPPNRPGNPKDPPVQVFYNAPQYCSYTCPSGAIFRMSIGAGYCMGLDQASADILAQGRVCALVQARHICMEDISSRFCLGTPISVFARASGAGPFTFQLMAGALPTGLALASNGLISGTPVAPGDFGFTLRAFNLDAGYADKAYTFHVMGMSPSILPDASLGTPYSQVLTGVGGIAPYKFSLELGTLPLGITLAEDGTVSGTPTAAGTSNFTIGVADSAAGFCTQTITMAVVSIGYQICDWVGVRSIMTGFGSWPASAFPAWNGVFDQKIIYGFGPTPNDPVWYFLGRSILGKKAAADETPDYPAPSWQSNDCYTQFYYETGAGTWFLWIESTDCSNVDYVGYTMTNHDINDPRGVYARFTQSGSMTGPPHLTIQSAGSAASCCGPSTDWTNNPGSCALRIASYLDSVFTSCLTCRPSDIGSVAWDGTFPAWQNIAGVPVFRAVTGAFDHNINGTRFSGASVQFDPGGNRWVLQVLCVPTTSPSPMSVVIREYARAGSNPVGIYTDTGNGCGSGPATVEIEGY